MALTFQVKQIEITGGAYSSVGPRSIANTQLVSWKALAEDDLSPPIPDGLEPDKISELDVLSFSPGGFRFWPEPNVDLFTQAGLDGVFYVQPWLFCSALRSQRDRGNRLLWTVLADYTTGQREKLTMDDLDLIPAPAAGAGLVDAYPFLKETIWGEENRILQEENDQRTENDPDPTNQALELPTGNLFDEPFYGRFPKKTIRQSQYEAHASEAAVKAAIDARLFTTNGTIFEGDPAGADVPGASAEPPRWMITSINYQKVRLPDANFQYTDAYLMTYLVERSSKPRGWWESRALIDNVVIDENGERVPARDLQTGQQVFYVKLNPDGTLRDPQTGPADYQDFVVQPNIPWSFLK